MTNFTLDEAKKVLGLFTYSVYDRYIKTPKKKTFTIKFKLGFSGLSPLTKYKDSTELIELPSPLATNYHRAYNEFAINNYSFGYFGYYRDGDENSERNLAIKRILVSALPLEFIGKGEDLFIKVTNEHGSKESKTIFRSVNDVSTIGDIERWIVTILENDILNDVTFGSKCKVTFYMENISGMNGVVRKKINEVLCINPRKMMDTIFRPKYEEPIGYYARRMSGFEAGSIKDAIFRMPKKEERIKAINLIYKMNVPISRSADQVREIIKQLPDDYLGFYDVSDAIKFVMALYNCDFDSIQESLQKVGYLK